MPQFEYRIEIIAKSEFLPKLNELGQQGWEMCFAVPLEINVLGNFTTTREWRFECVLKREIPRFVLQFINKPDPYGSSE